MASQDFHMAYDVHEQLNCLGVTENAIGIEKENTFYIQTLVDKALELIDPTPNIHTLFVQFNARFFWNVLTPVQIKWSNRMTSCAGVCTFHSRNKECIISLSAPLLKLRPRKDLVETLLHEMIHAYLFLTNNDRDRDGHGPNFCKHMYRINKEAGTNITIYHNFHDEVRLYKQHWWKCNGPCQHRPPFFGTVRRSMNRAPGPTDYWWSEHQRKCNGEFIKIKEPAKFKLHPKHSDKSKSKDQKPNKNIIDMWFKKNTSVIDATAKPTSSKVSLTNSDSKILTQRNNDKPSTSRDNGGTNSFRVINEKNTQDLLEMKKLGDSSNNVHGWGISGSSGKVEKDNSKNVSKNPAFSCSGVLGGSNTGKSNLITKFMNVNDDENRQCKLMRKDSSSESSESSMATRQERSVDNSVLNMSQPRNNSVPCPTCNVPMTLENIYRHVDRCLINDNTLIDEINNNINNNNNNEELMLPIRTFSTSTVEQNIDTNTTSNTRLRLDNPDETVEYVNCPVCNRRLPSADINQHLDKCLLEADTIRKVAIPSTSRASYDDSIISINSFSNSDLDDSVIIENHSIVNETPQSYASTSTSKSDTTDFEYKCLVCNRQIPPEISLNEHLEECIGSVFNDETMIIDDYIDQKDEDKLDVENNSTENRYPCPVCMQLISENLMNQHLDMCLKNE
ncbi:DNA-dependent metalloprotease SPRTN [Anoplolepis gracilipes]|uniref:DNA-dependent metalloprotease SPRTN n=1 Tax=Anoplolepis gracilipes TaxID=354296 RepID=UPI003BA172FF